RPRARSLQAHSTTRQQTRPLRGIPQVFRGQTNIHWKCPRLSLLVLILILILLLIFFLILILLLIFLLFSLAFSANYRLRSASEKKSAGVRSVAVRTPAPPKVTFWVSPKGLLHQIENALLGQFVRIV